MNFNVIESLSEEEILNLYDIEVIETYADLKCTLGGSRGCCGGWGWSAERVSNCQAYLNRSYPGTVCSNSATNAEARACVDGGKGFCAAGMGC